MRCQTSGENLPHIFSLVSDINSLFTKGHKADKQNIESLGRAVAEAVEESLQEPLAEKQPPRLRMSNLGRKDRQIWYDFHAKESPEKLPASAKIKFLFGHILERMLIFLAIEAGHDVQDIQKEVCVDGIKGHQDAKIDGIVVDAKSCSTQSFKKFQAHDLQDDPFGYIGQIGGYSKANDDADAAFLAIDKTLGEITLMPIGAEKLKEYDVSGRIKRIKEVVNDPTPPERCYPDKPYGESGNMSLGIGCSYCKHKFECWADANDGKGLRIFLYSGKPVFFTHVAREPKVAELFR